MIAFEGAFHGRTFLSLASATSRTHPYKAPLVLFAPDVYRVPFPNEVPRIWRAFMRSQRSSARSLTQVAAEHVAAIVVEPVQGEGGFVAGAARVSRGAPPRSATSTASCRVADEVQTGFGRTGKLFAIEHYGVEPDLVTIAKSIAAGLPLSGVLGKAAVMDAPADIAVGGTYVGNPVAQAAALAVLDVIDDERLIERAASDRRAIRARMECLARPLRRGRRRSRPRRDARDRARRDRSDEGAGAGARHRGRRRGPSAGSCSSRPGSTRTASACSCRS